MSILSVSNQQQGSSQDMENAAQLSVQCWWLMQGVGQCQSVLTSGKIGSEASSCHG